MASSSASGAFALARSATTRLVRRTSLRPASSSSSSAPSPGASRLPESITRLGQLHGSATVKPIDQNKVQSRAAARARFGKFGFASGVDPATLWPTVEEVEEELRAKLWVEYEDALAQMQVLRAEREKRERLRTEKVNKALANYDQTLAKYEATQVKAEQEKDEKEAVLERRIREIHEYFGYWMDPKDPRFEVMLQQKEAEEKKAVKEAKKEEQKKKKIAEVMAGSP